MTASPPTLAGTGINRAAFVYYRRLGRLEQYVNEHYSDPISLSTAAGVAGLEKTYFSRFFHEKTGVCFRDWLTLVRIGRAMKLMTRRNITITTVAMEVGYSDLRSFERAFARITGGTPSEFKKSARPC